MLRSLVVVLVVFFASPAILQAESCIDYGAYMRWIGGAPAPGGAMDVVLSGDTAFLACDTGGLQVLDVTDPASPVTIGSLSGEANLMALSESQIYLYVVASDAHTFTVVDVSDPTSPEPAGSIPVTGNTYGLAVMGDYAYLANFNQGILVVDVADPAHPAMVAQVGAFPLTLAAYADRVYYLDLVGTTNTLRILDVSDPLNPAPLGSIVIPADYYTSARIRGTVLYATCLEGMRTFDVSNPLAPFFLGFGRTDDICYDVAVIGSHGFAAAFDGIYSFDVSNPSSPVRAGRVETEDGESLWGIDVSLTTAFLAAGSDGMRTADIAIPMDPPLIGSIDLNGDAQGVAVAGDYAYVCCVDAGLKVVDASDPSALSVVSSVTVTGMPEDVAVYGSYAYVVGGTSVLTVVDISDPENARIEIARQLGGGSCTGIAIQGGFAYVSNWLAGVQILDLADPGNPILVGTVDVPGYAKDILVAGNTVYVACWTAGLVTLDVSMPGQPVYLGVFDTERALDVAVAGRYAYVADATSVMVLEITDPAHPAYVVSIPLPFPGAYGVAVWGNVLYAAGLNGLDVLDVTQPAGHVVLGSLDTAGSGQCVTVKRGLAWIADGAAGLKITALQCGAPTAAPEDAAGILDVDLAVAPNPALGDRIEMRFSLSRADRIVVDVFDPSGRRVACLAEGVGHAGPQVVLWDGCGDDGRRLPNGVYTCRLRAGDRERSEKLVLAR